MSATVDNVHHWDRKNVGIRAADVAVKGHTQSLCCRMGSRKTYAEDGVGAKLALRCCTIKGEHFVVECALIEDTVALQSRCNNVVYVGNGLQNAFAAETILVSVAKLEGFVLAG